MTLTPHCPDCDQTGLASLDRRSFLKAAGMTAAAAAFGGRVWAADETAPTSETLVTKLYQTLTPKQKEEICFAWDHTDDRGLLRTRVSNNWNITDLKLNVGGDFYNKEQQEIIRAIFDGLYAPEWRERILKQLQDDAGGYGKEQTIALFGEPGTGKFEFVMTGRHLTIRCDGDSAEHVAFGGPIFYGHAAQGFNEKADHPGNVFWHQALKANALYQMLDGKQRSAALIDTAPQESHVGFQGKEGKRPGIRVGELSQDQQAHAQEVLKLLLEPYRQADRDEALKCLDAQGGLADCRLSFYKSGDLGDDQVWDIWRLEGPAFVWHYRGSPHVHVWANIASDPSVKTNAAG